MEIAFQMIGFLFPQGPFILNFILFVLLCFILLFSDHFLTNRSLGKKHLDLAYSTLKKMDFVVDTGEGEREESLFQTRLGNVLERYFGFRELKNTGGLSKKNHLSPHFVDCMKGWLTERNQLDIELVKRWRESESSPSV